MMKCVQEIGATIFIESYPTDVVLTVAQHVGEGIPNTLRVYTEETQIIEKGRVRVGEVCGPSFLIGVEEISAASRINHENINVIPRYQLMDW